MLRVIIERQLKEGKSKSLIPLLRELRAAALKHTGYITGETLVNTEDPSIVATLSTWRDLDDWRAWENSAARVKIAEQIQHLLRKKPKVNIYYVSATNEK